MKYDMTWCSDPLYDMKLYDIVHCKTHDMTWHNKVTNCLKMYENYTVWYHMKHIIWHGMKYII